MFSVFSVFHKWFALLDSDSSGVKTSQFSGPSRNPATSYSSATRITSSSSRGNQAGDFGRCRISLCAEPKVLSKRRITNRRSMESPKSLWQGPTQ